MEGVSSVCFLKEERKVNLEILKIKVEDVTEYVYVFMLG